MRFISMYTTFICSIFPTLSGTRVDIKLKCIHAKRFQIGHILGIFKQLQSRFYAIINAIVELSK